MKPEAGQWWFPEAVAAGSKAIRVAVFIVGQTTEGRTIFQCNMHSESTDLADDEETWKHWYHEPRCTGWDWVVPEQPQPAEDPVCDECGGSGEVDSGGFTPWMAPINVPCGKCSKPESQPDEWIEITDPDHVLRSCDFFQIKDQSWHRIASSVGKTVAGCRYFAEAFRCRRRDLPKVEQKKTTDDFGMYLESVIAKDPQLKAEVDAAEAELAAIEGGQS